MSTWNVVTIYGIKAAGIKRKTLRDFDLYENPNGGEGSNGWDVAWVNPTGLTPEEVVAKRKDSAQMEGQTTWRADEIGEWIVELTSKHPELEVTWSQTWDDDGPGAETLVYRAGEIDRAKSQTSAMVPLDYALLIDRGTKALEHLERTADGDSNDAEIAAGQEVADILRAFIEGITPQ
jgi:hypothetical protein